MLDLTVYDFICFTRTDAQCDCPLSSAFAYSYLSLPHTYMCLDVPVRLAVAWSQFLRRRPTHMRILRVRKFYYWRYRIYRFAEFTKNRQNKGEVITERRLLYSRHSVVRSVHEECYLHTYVCVNM